MIMAPISSSTCIVRPSHEHAEMLEEACVYIDTPTPAWGTQFVYTDPQVPELVEVVREGDCVVMPKGYHPNVAAPGGSINFLWIMAAIARSRIANSAW